MCAIQDSLSSTIYIVTREHPELLRQSLYFAILHLFTMKIAVFQATEYSSTYIWDHNSKLKALIKKVKTCGPALWSTIANGMSYSHVRSVSIEKLRYKQSWP